MPSRSRDAQLLHRDVHIDDFIGALKKVIGNGFADDRVRRSIDRVVQRLKVLNIDCRHHVYAGVEQFQNIFVALAVPASGDVGMRQFIHNHGVWMTRENRVHIHLFQVHTAIGNHPLGDDLEIANLFRGLLPSVRLHQSNHNIHALLALQQGVIQHVIGFPHAGSGPDIDSELGWFLLPLEHDL